jgi:hypothetical protein
VREIGSGAKRLPAPQRVVFDSLAEPHRPGTRPWLALCRDEVEPHILEAEAPDRIVWSTLWPSRPDDRVRFDLATQRGETLLRFTLLTPDDPPDEQAAGHLRYRMSVLLFGELRRSYGQ